VATASTPAPGSAAARRNDRRLGRDQQRDRHERHALRERGEISARDRP
jgi:hypothetical protein